MTISLGVMIMEVEPDIDVEDEASTCQRSVPQKPPSQPAPNIVFDTDPAFFSPDEKLKVGVIREEDGTQVFLCMYCRMRCETALSLKMHVRVYHMPVLVYDNGLGTVETRYRMGIKLQNTTSTEFSTTEKPFACLFCESSYKLQSSLQSHFREHHSPHKPFQCLECKEGFRRPIELSRHRLYRCPVRKTPTFPPSRKER
ncbi:oocyte zinc finger protein XlCOF19-like [Macrobrachium rosenbergii]|uniref:oocyte zinc finger protein XlCOF19-like n=1 Tax=Macrobrachium rosenbergii TaxID=79674 RepID=UPI0034D6ED00